MYHCCAIDRMLLTSQYSTRPEAKNRKNTVNTHGSHITILACIGSGGTWFSLVCRNIEMPIRIGSTKYGSITDKSWIHNMNGACRSSTDSISTQYSAMKTGIWTRMGR